MQSSAISTSQDNFKRLSVLIHQDGLSFYIHTAAGIESVIERSFKHSSNPIEILKFIEELYQQEESLNEKFQQVKLIYNHEIFTIVPSDLFIEESAADYLKYNTRLLQTDTVSVDDNCDGMNLNIVYVAYSNINNFFFEKYGDYSYFHYSTLSLPNIGLESNGVFVEVTKSHFYLTVIDEGKLIAHNLFPHQQVEDILFYTLFALKQHQLDPETIHLTLLQPEMNQDLFDLLYTYIRNVTFLTDYPKYLEQLICA